MARSAKPRKRKPSPQRSKWEKRRCKSGGEGCISGYWRLTRWNASCAEVRCGLRGWSGDTVWQSWLWCMSRWPECSVAAESRRGGVASILRGTEQKTTIHTLYQSVLSCLIVVSVHMVHKECWRNIRFVVFFNLLGVLIPIDERLLINTPDTFLVAYIERVLRPQISRMSRFDFATGLVITGFTLQCCDLAVS